MSKSTYRFRKKGADNRLDAEVTAKIAEIADGNPELAQAIEEVTPIIRVQGMNDLRRKLLAHGMIHSSSHHTGTRVSSVVQGVYERLSSQEKRL